jgi:hypothetical protein
MDNKNKTPLDAEYFDDAADRVADETSSSPIAPVRKSHKKLWIILGIVALVIAGVGIGGWVWHEQPSFCNAICHQPMDPYVESYYSQDSTLLVTAHAEAGDECLDCHEPAIDEQVGEVMKWISGDFKDPLPMTKTGTRAFCLVCHDSEEIKASTVNYGGSSRNPHDSHYGDALECYSCHRVHQQSTLYCNECHPDITGPSGWKA